MTTETEGLATTPRDQRSSSSDDGSDDGTERDEYVQSNKDSMHNDEVELTLQRSGLRIERERDLTPRHERRSPSTNVSEYGIAGDDLLELDENTGPKLRRSSRQCINERGSLVFDQKYHPLDEITRPAQARKRRRLHNLTETREEVDEEDTDSDSSLDPIDQVDSLGNYVPPTSIKWDIASRLCGDHRQSRRLESKPSPNYNRLVHPQDELLLANGVPIGRRISAPVVMSGVEVSSDSESDQPVRKRASMPNRHRLRTMSEEHQLDPEEQSDLNVQPNLANSTNETLSGSSVTNQNSTSRTIENVIASYNQAWEAWAQESVGAVENNDLANASTQVEKALMSEQPTQQSNIYRDKPKFIDVIEEDDTESEVSDTPDPEESYETPPTPEQFMHFHPSQLLARPSLHGRGPPPFETTPPESPRRLNANTHTTAFAAIVANITHPGTEA